MTYLGGYSEEVRASMLRQWCAVCDCPAFELLPFMCSERERLKWKAEGLPSDGLRYCAVVCVCSLLMRLACMCVYECMYVVCACLVWYACTYVCVLRARACTCSCVPSEGCIAIILASVRLR